MVVNTYTETTFVLKDYFLFAFHNNQKNIFILFISKSFRV